MRHGCRSRPGGTEYNRQTNPEVIRYQPGSHLRDGLERRSDSAGEEENAESVEYDPVLLDQSGSVHTRINLRDGRVPSGSALTVVTVAANT